MFEVNCRHALESTLKPKSLCSSERDALTVGCWLDWCWWQVVNETIPALVELRDKGLVRHIGITGLPLKIFCTVLDRCRLPSPLCVFWRDCLIALSSDLRSLKHSRTKLQTCCWQRGSRSGVRTHRQLNLQTPKPQSMCGVHFAGCPQAAWS